MADTARARSVYRYFDLADAFVQILLIEPETMRLETRPSLNRASYRRLVIETCCPEFKGDLQRALDTLFAEDPLMVEDLLYQLCVEVNPPLDIHEVRLSVEGEEEGERAEARTDGRAGPAEMERLLARLRERVAGLERRLSREVVGQERAVARVAAAMRKAAVGLGAQERPLASLLFVGRTGTGKTELARRLARELFAEGPSDGLVRIDCSEYALAHEYSKLIGSPPGYVGHEDGGQLTDALLARPASVVVFDEVEKAHPRLHNLLLQILEEGCLTDGKGRRVGFERAVVVLTSNCGAAEMAASARPLGFERAPALGNATLTAITRDAIERSFSPELIGRLDQVLVFEELDVQSAERIAARQLFELAQRARRRGFQVAFTPAVARWVAQRGFSADYGARELRRVLETEIEPRLADHVLAGTLERGALLRVRVRNGELCFETEL